MNVLFRPTLSGKTSLLRLMAGLDVPNTGRIFWNGEDVTGVRKVNIDTDLRMALTGAIRKVFAENPGEFDPRKYLAPGVQAMSAVCRDRF